MILISFCTSMIGILAILFIGVPWLVDKLCNCYCMIRSYQDSKLLEKEVAEQRQLKTEWMNRAIAAETILYRNQTAYRGCAMTGDSSKDTHRLYLVKSEQLTRKS